MVNVVLIRGASSGAITVAASLLPLYEVQSGTLSVVFLRVHVFLFLFVLVFLLCRSFDDDKSAFLTFFRCNNQSRYFLAPIRS